MLKLNKKIPQQKNMYMLKFFLSLVKSKTGEFTHYAQMIFYFLYHTLSCFFFDKTDTLHLHNISLNLLILSLFTFTVLYFCIFIFQIKYVGE